MPEVTTVLAVRHGQSAWNAIGRWQGQADPPLSELGVLQAISSGDAVAALGQVDALVASDLERALATAVLLADRAGLEPPRVDPRWRERDAGEWTGRTRAEIEAAYPGALAARRWPPGWEPDDHVAARVRDALDELHRLHPGGVVVIVTHGGVIRALEREAGLDDDLVPNLGGRWFAVDDRGVEAGDKVVLIDHATVNLTDPQAV